MRENRTYGSEGWAVETHRLSLPLSKIVDRRNSLVSVVFAE